MVDATDSTDYLTALYLFDETELNHYIRENKEQKLVAGLIYIDNYEEVMQRVDSEQKTQDKKTVKSYEKAVKMANMMNIPILGLVENMSYFTCPDNGKDYAIFGDSHIDEIAADYQLPVLARLPINPNVAESFDAGLMETVPTDHLADAVAAIEQA